MTKDEMVGWHYQLDVHESEQAPGVGDGQGKPGMLQSMESQRVRHNLATEQQHICTSFSISLHGCWSFYLLISSLRINLSLLGP